MSAYLLAAGCAYLIGSIPFGYLAGRIAGVDVRTRGSGNIGATNVLRVLGKAYGYAVFCADALKGLLAVRIAGWINGSIGSNHDFTVQIAAAVCVVLGHSFPIWLRFRGGKGVATSLGACLGLIPLPTALAGVVWILAFALFRFVSLASISAAATLPLSVWILTDARRPGRDTLLIFTAVIAALIILRHRSNIVRLLHGTEPRFVRK